MPEAFPPGLRQRVGRNFAAVRPLRAPWKRSLAIAPLGIMILVGVPWYFGARPDLPEISVTLLGLSILQFLAGMCVVACALREAVPGRGLRASALLSLMAVVVAIFAAVTLLTAQASVTYVPAGREARYLRICLLTPVLLGMPLLGIAAGLAFRAFPPRPAIAVGMAGLGIGLLVDGGWRLFCEVTDPAHVLPAHGGAVTGLGLTGALCGWLWSRIGNSRY